MRDSGLSVPQSAALSAVEEDGEVYDLVDYWSLEGSGQLPRSVLKKLGYRLVKDEESGEWTAVPRALKVGKGCEQRGTVGVSYMQGTPVCWSYCSKEGICHATVLLVWFDHVRTPAYVHPAPPSPPPPPLTHTPCRRARPSPGLTWTLRTCSTGWT
jgi:hypothetical protein